MVERKVIYLVICLIFCIGLASSAAILDELHLNIQTTNSTGSVVAGTYDFIFNITTDAACSNVIYSNSTTLTTDSRGIVSYYLENVSLDYDQQYYLCHYRDGSLINASKISRSPYAFRAKYVNTSGISADANLALGSYNVSATYFLGSGRFLTDINSSALNFSEINYWTLSGNDVYYNDGNVGINTSSPQELLHVAGNILANGTINSTQDLCIEGGACLSTVAASGISWSTATNGTLALMSNFTDYYTKTEIDSFAYYNASDFDIANYYNTTQILGFGYYNSTDFDISNYYNTTQTDSEIASANTSLHDWVVAQGYTSGGINWSTATNGTLALNSSLVNYYLATNPSGFYNLTNFPYTNNLNFTNGANYWNATYYGGIGNFSAWNKSYFDLVDTPTIPSAVSDLTNDYGYYNSTTLPVGSYDDAWINDTFYNKTQILDFNYYNSTDFDIADYYNMTQTDTEISNANTSLRGWVVSQSYLTEETNWNANYSDFLDVAAWNDTGLIINWSEEIDLSDYLTTATAASTYATIDEPLWTSNFTVYNDSWSSVINSSYYLASNPDGFTTNASALEYVNSSGLVINWSSSTSADSELLDGYDSSFFMPLNTSVYGNFDFNGGWTSNGLSIIGGAIYAQSGYFYDLNSLSVNTLEINGSLIPEVGFDNTFDLGNSTLRWRDLYLGGDANVGGAISSSDWSNVSITESQISDLGDYITQDYGNATYYELNDFDIDDYITQTYGNATYAGIEWDYNQTIPAMNYADGKFFSDIANFTGTLNDGSYCTYDLGTDKIVCTSSVTVNESDPYWTGNYSAFLTHLNWSQVTNGTLALSSDLADYLTTATAATTYATIDEPLWTDNFTAYNTTWSTDTTYDAGSNLTLTGTTFSANMTGIKDYFDAIYATIGSIFSGSWNDLTDVPAGFSDGVDNDTTYSHLSNFTDDILWTTAFNATGDNRWLTEETNWNSNYTDFLTVSAWNDTGLIKDWNSTGYLIDWNSSGHIINWDPNGYIKDWNSTGYIKNWTAEINSANNSLASWANANFAGIEWDYNQTTAAINAIVGFNYYNSTDFDIGDYRLLTNVTFTGSLGDFAVNNSNLFIDVSEDKVGIGTSTPQNTLNVAGDLNVTSTSNLEGNVTIGDCIVFASGGAICST